MKRLLTIAAVAFASFSGYAQTAAGEKYDPIRVCVIEDDVLKEILAYYDKGTGNTYVDKDGELFTLDEVFPVENGYSASRSWYLNNDEIHAFGKTYVKYGLPRVLGV